jgi:hypothetical protein
VFCGFAAESFAVCEPAGVQFVGSVGPATPGCRILRQVINFTAPRKDLGEIAAPQSAAQPDAGPKHGRSRATPGQRLARYPISADVEEASP